MTDQTVPPGAAPGELERRADRLIVGDRIAAEFLPPFGDRAGDVLFVKPFQRGEVRWVFVAYMQTDGYHDSSTFLADKVIRLEKAAIPAGHDYSRPADDPGPPAGRVPPHLEHGRCSAECAATGWSAQGMHLVDCPAHQWPSLPADAQPHLTGPC